MDSIPSVEDPAVYIRNGVVGEGRMEELGIVGVETDDGAIECIDDGILGAQVGEKSGKSWQSWK